MKRLVLFDIDETMVYSDGVGRRALEAALTNVFKRPVDASKHSLSGKTDPQIFQEILVSLGYESEEIKLRLPEVFKLYLSYLEQEIKNSRGFGLHGGVQVLIESLRQDRRVYLALLTGNIEAGARLKLAPFGLNEFFPFGAFGCDSANRMDLPGFAHTRARKHLSLDFEPGEMVIIGDAVNDVLCAQGYGVKSIITATGKTPRNSLAELKPDFLFDSLCDTSRVLDAIFA